MVNIGKSTECLQPSNDALCKHDSYAYFLTQNDTSDL